MKGFTVYTLACHSYFLRAFLFLDTLVDGRENLLELLALESEGYEGLFRFDELEFMLISRRMKALCIAPWNAPCLPLLRGDSIRSLAARLMSLSILTL